MRERDAIGEIYEAAVVPGGWSTMPALFATYLSCDSAVVTLAEPDRQVAGCTHGLPDEALRSYADYYHKVDPWFAAGLAHLPAFRAARAADLFPQRQFLETEFYADFARRFGTVQAVGGYVPLGSAILTVAAHREAGRSFSRGDASRLQRLLPHLQRALLLRRRIGEPASGATGYAALEALALGVVVCDAAGRILFANDAARVAAADGGGIVLGAGLGGVGAAHGKDGRNLAALFADAAAGGPGGGLVLSGTDQARLFVLVTPLPSSISEELGHVIITLRPDHAGPTMSGFMLASLFGLTPAEAALALALLAGGPLAAIAKQRRVSENTLRSQLAQVLRKTGTANQRDLVRVLSLVPALRA